MFKPIKPKKETPPAPRRVDLESLLCKAIRAKQVIRIRYQNEMYNRTFEPYIVYRSPTGKVLVHGRQTRDDSNPMQGNDRRSFEVGRLNSVVLIEETFQHQGVLASFKTEIDMNIICSIEP
jgi:hypothetical protein